MGAFSDQLRVMLQETLWETGLSQAELARKTGLSPGQLSRFRRGERGLSLEMIDKVLDVLGLEVLFRRKDG
jgi:transcriptional regulator with XRE-family HTH domain